MGFPRYEHYKECEIPDLGEIPAAWQVIRNRYLFREQNERSSYGNETHLSMSQKFGLIPSADLREKSLQSESYEGARLCRKNDLVLNRLKAHLSVFSTAPCDGLVSPDYSVFRLNNSGMMPKYFEHLFKTSVYLSEFNRRVRGIVVGFYRLYSDEFMDIRTLCPPIEEQRRIVTFLDEKTAEIDEAIAKKQRLIELLQEQKAILINQAVTKGLNPHAPMRDSGVEWIGEIPAHWEVKRAKHVFRAIVDTEHKTAPSFEDGEYLIVRTSNVRDGELRWKNALYTDEKHYHEWTRRAVPEADDILFTREAPAGEACIFPPNLKALIGQRMVLLKVNGNLLDPKFAVFSIYGGAAKRYITDLSVGSTVAHFNMSDIKNIPILMPELSEQSEISEYLLNITDAFNVVIERENCGISTLTEFKLILIANAVTGKIKV